MELHDRVEVFLDEAGSGSGPRLVGILTASFAGGRVLGGTRGELLRIP